MVYLQLKKSVLGKTNADVGQCWFDRQLQRNGRKKKGRGMSRKKESGEGICSLSRPMRKKNN